MPHSAHVSELRNRPQPVRRACAARDFRKRRHRGCG
jgi:hypothetical protein